MMNKLEAKTLKINWSMSYIYILTTNENAVKLAMNPVKDEVLVMGHFMISASTTQWISFLYSNSNNGHYI
jgi:hypothetical protein